MTEPIPGRGLSPDYPPLTPVEEYPLHGWDYGSRYACQGVLGVYDWRCTDCVNLAWNEVVMGRDTTTQWRQSAAHDERPVTLGWLVARSRAHGVKAESIRCGCVYDEHDSWCPYIRSQS